MKTVRTWGRKGRGRKTGRKEKKKEEKGPKGNYWVHLPSKSILGT